MGQRLTDYALVGLVILVIFGLFRLSRIVMGRVMKRLEKRYGSPGPDRTLFTAFLFLLGGLLFLPSVTYFLAFLNNEYLAGGMFLHLVLVAISIILFSIAEDMFRDFPSMEAGGDSWSVGEHFRRLAVPFALFWALGVVFLSPLFYSGLTVILAIFYIYSLSCRKSSETARSDKSS